MTTNYLSQQKVEAIISKQGQPILMQTTIENIQKGLVDFKEGYVQHERRSGFLFDGNTVEAMPARRVGKHIVFKIVNFHKPKPGKSLPSVMSTTICLDEKTGKPTDIIESTPLTPLRTGAVTGIAIKHLYPKAKTIGLIGAGEAGKASLQAACLVLNLKTIYANDLKLEALDSLQAAVEDFPHPPITRADLETVVRKSDVIICSTYGEEIVVKKKWIEPNVSKLIVSVGADTPGKSEVEPALYKEATIIADFKEQAIADGDVEVPIKQGIVTVNDISAELFEIVTGKQIKSKPLIIFDSTGDSVSDLVITETILRLSKA